MTVYESTGTYDAVTKKFNLDVQLTDIAPDTFKFTAYYDISTANRYAFVAILQTTDENDNNLSTYPPDFTFTVNNVPFTSLSKAYCKIGDKDIYKIPAGQTVHVVVHHGIGFNPVTNTFDDQYIKNYKAGTYTYYSKGAKPGARGYGILS